MKIFLKLKWLLARVLFVFFVFIGIASASILGFLLAPIYSWYFFGSFNCFKYLKYGLPMIKVFCKILICCLQNPDYRKAFAVPLTAEPLIAPNFSNIRINKFWDGEKESCSGCVKCCLKVTCPFLDLQNQKCLSYGSFFWRYFNCGRYPSNIDQISYYECPKWVVVDQKE